MNPKPECGHALGLDLVTTKDEDGIRSHWECHACGATFDHKILDGKHIAISKATAAGDGYATLTLHRTTSATRDDDT